VLIVQKTTKNLQEMQSKLSGAVVSQFSQNINMLTPSGLITVVLMLGLLSPFPASMAEDNALCGKSSTRGFDKSES
jgi:hypothetical protein